MSRKLMILWAVTGLAAGPVSAQQTPPAATAAASAYAPYDWLVGDWTAKAGPGVIRELLTYGPNRSYIRFSVFTGPVDGPEHLHFEGIALWNGKTRVLDYLFAVEPGSGVQENGTIRAEADGTIVREVEFISPTGQLGTFRQTFRRTGPDRMVTTLARKTTDGWAPTFPGSDRIEMTRRG